MDDLITIGIIAAAVFSVLGLGVRVHASFKSGSKTTIKNVKAGGDVVGRDKVQK
ncbi:MAG: hypothetical protein SVC26_00060 [Pseudomonadota bacterium]|nr:hypothetical protein [Pseudomonadota bacterium]